MHPGRSGLQYAGLAASGFRVGPVRMLPGCLMLLPIAAPCSCCIAFQRKPAPPDSRAHMTMKRPEAMFAALCVPGTDRRSCSGSQDGSERQRR